MEELNQFITDLTALREALDKAIKSSEAASLALKKLLNK